MGVSSCVFLPALCLLCCRRACVCALAGKRAGGVDDESSEEEEEDEEDSSDDGDEEEEEEEEEEDEDNAGGKAKSKSAANGKGGKDSEDGGDDGGEDEDEEEVGTQPRFSHWSRCIVVACGFAFACLWVGFFFSSAIDGSCSTAVSFNLLSSPSGCPFVGPRDAPSLAGRRSCLR